MKTRKRVTRKKMDLAWALVGASLLFLPLGCEQEGPLEQAGEKLDRAVEKAGDAVEEATDREGPLERAGERMDETVEKAKETVEKAAGR